MYEIKCSTVLDLLPLYVEDMVSTETGQAVAEHLDSCETCRARYEQMLSKVPVPVEENMNKAKPLKRFRFHMLLNILGFPLWLPLLITVFAVALTIYICIWVVDICAWCIPVACGAAFLAGIAAAAGSFAAGLAGNGLFFTGCSITGAGLAVLSFFACLWVSKYIIKFSVYLWTQLTRVFTRRKGDNNND